MKRDVLPNISYRKIRMNKLLLWGLIKLRSFVERLKIVMRLTFLDIVRKLRIS